MSCEAIARCLVRLLLEADVLDVVMFFEAATAAYMEQWANARKTKNEKRKTDNHATINHGMVPKSHRYGLINRSINSKS